MELIEEIIDIYISKTPNLDGALSEAVSEFNEKFYFPRVVDVRVAFLSMEIFDIEENSDREFKYSFQFKGKYYDT